jgi:hypothetical protein
MPKVTYHVFTLSISGALSLYLNKMDTDRGQSQHAETFH